MADASVVLDNVLCFLIARYGKTPNKPPKDAVFDFIRQRISAVQRKMCCVPLNRGNRI